MKTFMRIFRLPSPTNGLLRLSPTIVFRLPFILGNHKPQAYGKALCNQVTSYMNIAVEKFTIPVSVIVIQAKWETVALFAYFLTLIHARVEANIMVLLDVYRLQHASPLGVSYCTKWPILHSRKD